MKRLIVSLLAALGIAVAVPAMAFAYGGNQTDVEQCGNGKVVVNVNYTLTNDTDSAVGGGTWANDTINRHLQIVRVGDDSYCAVVSDTGSFVTFAGSSPSGNGTVDANVKGRINGGYRTSVFSGSLVSDPTYKAKGQLGSFDLQCDRAQNCPGDHPTVSSYVSGWGGNLDWWGWEYKTAQNGIWIDADSGITGDITS